MASTRNFIAVPSSKIAGNDRVCNAAERAIFRHQILAE
jgi:hypothetical protein